MRKNRGVTFFELMIALAVFGIFTVMSQRLFFGTRRAFVKTMDAQTLNEVAQRIVAHLKNDIQSANYVVSPSLDADPSEKLVLVRQMPDFNRDPHDNSLYCADGNRDPMASVYYNPVIIQYTVEEDDQDSTGTFKILKRAENRLNHPGDTVETIIGRFHASDAKYNSPGRIEQMWFSRKSFQNSSIIAGKNVPVPPPPHENGCGPSVVNIKLHLRNPSDEAGTDDAGNPGGYRVRLDFALQVRGGRL